MDESVEISDLLKEALPFVKAQHDVYRDGLARRIEQALATAQPGLSEGPLTAEQVREAFNLFSRGGWGTIAMRLNEALITNQSMGLSEGQVREDQNTEFLIRMFLWDGHGHEMKYGDDGEMQCNQCPLSDYKRAPLDQLVEQARLAALETGMKRLAASQATPQPDHCENCDGWKESAEEWKRAAMLWQREICEALHIPLSDRATVIAMLRATPQEPPREQGEVSDGYHTFDELYEHRHALFSVICALHDGWKSMLHEDGTMFDGWFIAGVNTPKGQATYHLPMNWWTKLNCQIFVRAPRWDGHTAKDVPERIASLSEPPASPTAGERKEFGG